MENSHVGILAECSYPLPITRYLIIKLVEIYHFPEIETIGGPLQTYLYRDEPSNHSNTNMCCTSSGLDRSLLSTLGNSFQPIIVPCRFVVSSASATTVSLC